MVKNEIKEELNTDGNHHQFEQSNDDSYQVRPASQFGSIQDSKFHNVKVTNETAELPLVVKNVIKEEVFDNKYNGNTNHGQFEQNNDHSYLVRPTSQFVNIQNSNVKVTNETADHSLGAKKGIKEEKIEKAYLMNNQFGQNCDYQMRQIVKMQKNEFHKEKARNMTLEHSIGVKNAIKEEIFDQKENAYLQTNQFEQKDDQVRPIGKSNF